MCRLLEKCRRLSPAHVFTASSLRGVANQQALSSSLEKEREGKPRRNAPKWQAGQQQPQQDLGANLWGTLSPSPCHPPPHLRPSLGGWVSLETPQGLTD